jgi:hypothetical protein
MAQRIEFDSAEKLHRVHIWPFLQYKDLLPIEINDLNFPHRKSVQVHAKSFLTKQIARSECQTLHFASN